MTVCGSRNICLVEAWRQAISLLLWAASPQVAPRSHAFQRGLWIDVDLHLEARGICVPRFAHQLLQCPQSAQGMLCIKRCWGHCAKRGEVAPRPRKTFMEDSGEVGAPVWHMHLPMLLIVLVCHFSLTLFTSACADAFLKCMQRSVDLSTLTRPFYRMLISILASLGPSTINQNQRACVWQIDDTNAM